MYLLFSNPVNTIHIIRIIFWILGWTLLFLPLGIGEYILKRTTKKEGGQDERQAGLKMENLKIIKGSLLYIHIHDFSKISIHDHFIYLW